MPILPYKGTWPVIEEDVFIAPGAMIIGNVTIRRGASIWYNTVVRGDTGPIVIGRNTNIQDNCTLHLDADAPLTIGDDCTIGHGAVIHGATLEDRILVGMNAVILSHARIASHTIVGACSLVTERKHFPAGILIMGVPARQVRELTAVEQEDIVTSATGYYERAREHKKSVELMRNS